MCNSARKWVYVFQNNSRDLDPSYKISGIILEGKTLSYNRRNTVLAAIEPIMENMVHLNINSWNAYNAVYSFVYIRSTVKLKQVFIHEQFNYFSSESNSLRLNTCIRQFCEINVHIRSCVLGGLDIRYACFLLKYKNTFTAICWSVSHSLDVFSSSFII